MTPWKYQAKMTKIAPHININEAITIKTKLGRKSLPKKHESAVKSLLLIFLL